MQKISIVINVQGKIFKTREEKKKLFWKLPQATPNANPNPNLTLTPNPNPNPNCNSNPNPRVRV